MALETGTFISDLNVSNPVNTDGVTQADDHLRLIKSTVKATFPNITGAVNPTHTEINYMVGVTSSLQSQLGLKAPLAAPVFTGIPTAPTAAVDTSSLQLATCAYVINQGYLKSSTAAATYSTPASVSSALGPYLTSATAAATYSTPASVTTALAPYATTSYVNTQIAGINTASVTFLGTITASGATPSIGGLSLGAYSFVRMVFNGVSHTNTSAPTITMNGIAMSGGFTASAFAYGFIDIDLSTGIASSNVDNTPRTGYVAVTNGSTSISFALSGAGTFDAGSVRVYGIK